MIFPFQPRIPKPLCLPGSPAAAGVTRRRSSIVYVLPSSITWYHGPHPRLHGWHVCDPNRHCSSLCTLCHISPPRDNCWGIVNTQALSSSSFPLRIRLWINCIGIPHNSRSFEPRRIGWRFAWNLFWKAGQNHYYLTLVDFFTSELDFCQHERQHQNFWLCISS